MALQWWIVLEKLSFQHQAGCLNFCFQNKCDLPALMWLPCPRPELEERLFIYAHAEAVGGLTLRLIRGSCVMAINHHTDVCETSVANANYHHVKRVKKSFAEFITLLFYILMLAQQVHGLTPEKCPISVLLTPPHPSVVSGTFFSKALSCVVH